MRFLLDENVPKQVTVALRARAMTIVCIPEAPLRSYGASGQTTEHPAEYYEGHSGHYCSLAHEAQHEEDALDAENEEGYEAGR